LPTATILEFVINIESYRRKPRGKCKQRNPVRDWSMLVTPILLLALTACGSNDNKSSDLPTSPASSSSVPSTPPPSTVAPSMQPTAAPTRSSQKYDTLTLVLDHSAQPPAVAQAALAVYEEFERSAHKTMATNVEDPNLAKKATAQPLGFVRGVMRDQKAKGLRTGGTVTVKVKLYRASVALAAFNGCYDQSKSVLVRANGTSYAGPGAKQYPRMQLTVIVSNTGGLWRVTEYNLKADKC
jgi:hypothetical protein